MSYLLYYAEKGCNSFLDPLCKIILSTVYSHCRVDQDKTAIVDLMEELLEIYLNFYNDIRRQIHSKYSSFCLVYRNFCDELSELKTFYKLALFQPIMQVLSEDYLFLDIDSNRAAMRFYPKERTKHFGEENSDEYRENLVQYKKWTLKTLKLLIDNFINSLRSNIFAFPQSLAKLIIRVYTKLIEHLDFQKVYAICTDLIFCFLICPAIQNPDLFGIIDIHVNHIAHYNLLQCAQIIQLLALSKLEKCNSSYQEVCDLFDKDCLSFVIDHILGIFNNFSLPKSIDSSPLPYFLISEFELKLLLEYIKILLEDSDQNDNPVKVYFDKLPESVRNFHLDNALTKSDSLTRKGKSFESNSTVVDFSEVILSKNEDFVSNYKFLFFTRNILQIATETTSPKMIGLKSEKDFIAKIREKRILISDDVDVLIKELEGLFSDSTHYVDVKLTNKNQSTFIDKVDSNFPCLLDSSTSHLDFLGTFNHRQIDCSFKENLSEKLEVAPKGFSDLFGMTPLENLNFKETTPESATLLNLDQPTSTATQGEIASTFDTVDSSAALLPDLEPPLQQTNLSDKIPEAFLVSQSEQQEEDNVLNKSAPTLTNESGTSVLSQRGGSIHKKGFFTLSNFKNIKDKVKNISIKDNKLRPSTLESYDNLNGSKDNFLNNLSKERFDVANVKAKTSEILAKYKSSNSKSATDDLLDLDTFEPNVESLIAIGDDVDHTPVDHFAHIKNKLRKLMSLINLSHAYQSYRFLDLESKRNFVMFLRVCRATT